ncbi:glycosyltransferase family 4 protein [Soonwooa sp.]|uniref:glycosyltransferase family 4 protein n=1 Tax=Soonwooa sp. TaxID=1938592 RepID=UPI00289E4897|nr:glycosyltransferase family 4 protein [Soonwooa sp.]
MKVLFISSWYPNKLEPTNGNFVQRHAEAVALQHHVEVLHAIGDPNQKEKFLFDEKVINGLKTLIVYYRNTKNPLINFRRRMKAYKLGFQNMQKPDIVHANVMHNNMLFAVHLKKKYKIPYVVTEHWTAFQENATDSSGYFGKSIAKRIATNANHILPVCDRLKRGIRSMGVKTPISIVPNVVDTDIFSKRKIESRPTQFLHISSLTYMKNIPAILETFLKLHNAGYNFRLSIGGDGDIKPILEFIKKNNLDSKISVFGTLSHTEVAAKMQASDAFILFSRYENQPCVINESMSVGLFVFSSDVGGISEFFPEKFGVLIPKENNDIFYASLTQYLDNKLETASIEEMHTYAVQTFGKESISNQFTKIYNECFNP